MRNFFILGSILVLACCTKVPAEVDAGACDNKTVVVGGAEGAIMGTMALKLTPQAAEDVLVAQTTTRADETRSGIENMDVILNKIGAEQFQRIIEYDEEFEQEHRAAGLHLWYRVSFNEETSLESAAELFAANPNVAHVELTMPRLPEKPMPMPSRAVLPPDGDASTRAARPMNDPLLGYQWHFHNQSDGSFIKQQSGADINLFDAWSLCAGDPGIIVAVMDHAVQTTHPDLAANIWTSPSNSQMHGRNFWDNKVQLDWKTTARDPETGKPLYADHGTHVAGTIAAVSNNSLGVSGIAGGRNGNGVKIMSCQIMGYSDGAKNYDSNFQSFVFAADNGAVIAQNSWGLLEPNTNTNQDMTTEKWNLYGATIREGINYFINNAGSKNKKFPNSPISGGLVIFAAGNSGNRVGDMNIWPAAYAPVIAVGSMGWDYNPAYYTNHGAWVDITAPGGDSTLGATSDGQNYGGNAVVLSTVLEDPTMNFQDGRNDAANAEWQGCSFEQGTSMACPHVSGVAALGLSYAAQMGKKFTPAEFKALLLNSVYDIDSRFSGVKAGLTMSDYIGKMGGGCVDAFKLLLSIKGTPALYVARGADVTLDLSRYLSGARELSVTMAAADKTRLGLSSLPTINGMRMTLNCTNRGSAFVTIRAMVGDTPISREFAIVVRDGMAENGGWL